MGADTLEEFEQRVNVDGHVQFKGGQAVGVHLVQSIDVVWSEGVANASGQREQGRSTGRRLAGFGTEAKDRQVEDVCVLGRQHVQQLFIVVLFVGVLAVERKTVVEGQVTLAEVEAYYRNNS